ncbi:MAG: rod shape-determining protein MreD [Chloroflexota bacterium]|nr:rod shape-determining protein MreD [Chloroflexota bacterium]
MRCNIISLYVTIPLLAFLALIQSTVLPYVTIIGMKPELMLLVVVSWSLLRGAREGMAWAFIGGMFLDMLSGAPFGTITVALLLVSFLSGLGESTIFRTHIVLPLVASLLTTVAYDLTIMLILVLTGRPVAWLDSMMHVVLPSAVVNTLLMPLVFWPLQRLHRQTGREEIHW